MKYFLWKICWLYPPMYNILKISSPLNQGGTLDGIKILCLELEGCLGDPTLLWDSWWPSNQNCNDGQWLASIEWVFSFKIGPKLALQQSADWKKLKLNSILVTHISFLTVHCSSNMFYLFFILFQWILKKWRSSKLTAKKIKQIWSVLNGTILRRKIQGRDIFLLLKKEKFLLFGKMAMLQTFIFKGDLRLK